MPTCLMEKGTYVGKYPREEQHRGCTNLMLFVVVNDTSCTNYKRIFASFYSLGKLLESSEYYMIQ